MRVEVQYRPGHHVKGVEPQVVYQRVTNLQKRHGGRLEPSHLVDDARPERSPLHTAFEWDDSLAGEKYREDQARRLIRSVCVIEYDDDDEVSNRVNPAFVSVAERWDERPAYMESRNAMSDPAIRASVLAMAESQLEAWVQRNRNLQELKPYVEAINRVKRKRKPTAATVGARA